MIKKIIVTGVSILLILVSQICLSGEIYKTVDKDGNISFSSIAPHNSKIIKIVSVKKLIKKISVIKGASAQNIKLIAITKKLTDSRIKRSRERKEVSVNYNKEITLIKNQRLEGLKNLTDGKTAINTSVSQKQQMQKSIQKLIEQQE